jgi:hypothetical protein
MNAVLTERDERTVAVENAGYRWSSLTLSYGLLIIVAVRAFARGEQPWDLLALVVLAGAVHAAYQASRQVLQRRWVLASALSFVAAAVLALVIALVRR